MEPRPFQRAMRFARQPLSTLVEGGIVMTRTLKEPRILAQQVMLYRTFIRSLFSATD